MLTRGQLKVNTQIMSSDKALRQLGGIIDRMSMAIVIAGLFIGSSVVYYARIEPVVFGIPVIGFMGYVSALVLALMLGRNIWLNRSATLPLTMPSLPATLARQRCGQHAI